MGTSENKQPNVILIMADQLRYDAIGAHDNPILSTPTLNQMISNGTDFTNAYSATPTCIPARATLMSGLSQQNTGIVGYEEGANWNFPNTLGQVFSDRGYYAKAVGKMHVSPARKLMGFHHIDLHDGYLHVARKESFPTKDTYENTDDYLSWLREQVGYPIDLHDSGLDCNSWVARPFPFEERLHPTNWATEKAIEFLKRRDPTMPFFLKLSYVRPHSPLDPPQHYYDMYINQLDQMEGPVISEWAHELGLVDAVDKVDSLTGTLNENDYKRMIAGYYGLITHIDHQINRFLISLKEHEQLKNSIIVFTSDHGDQLGDHGLFRKGFAYQGSVHIPLIVYDPGENITNNQNRVSKVEDIIELRDILPTLLSFITDEELQNIDGQSFKNLVIKNEEESNWREYLHGEHMLGEFSNQYIVSKDWKYIWYTQSGREQLFDLKNDPDEINNLAGEERYQEKLSEMRDYLIEALKDRPEEFVQEGKLMPGQEQSPLINQQNKHK